MKNKKVGKLIARKRIKFKLSQEELAKKIGVSTSTIANWESDKSFPERENVYKLCDVLKLSDLKFYKITASKSTKKFYLVCGIIIAICLLCLISGFFSQEFANFFWFNIKNPINDIMFILNQHIHFSRTLFYIAFGIIILLLFVYIFSGSRRFSIETKAKIQNTANKLDIIALTIMAVPLILSLCGINNQKITFLYNQPNLEKEYTYQDMKNLHKFLANKVKELAPTFEREDDKIVVNNVEELAISDLKKLSNTFTFLKGNYPTKFINTAEYRVEDSDYIVLGETSDIQFTIKVDYEQSAPQLINTIEHELCHTKGVLRENEATYCSIMANFNSDNKVSNYAGYLEAYYRVNDSLYEIDDQEDKSYKEVQDSVVSMCLYNNYSEICEMTYRDIKKYDKKTDILQLSTYFLKNYKNYPDFIDILSKIKELDNNVKFEIDDKDVDLIQIKELINNNSNDKVIITLNNSETVFNKLSEIIKDKENMFYGIWQDESDSEDDEPKDYRDYIKPFEDKNDLFAYINGSFIDVFDYNKVTRLLLEYFDK